MRRESGERNRFICDVNYDTQEKKSLISKDFYFTDDNSHERSISFYDFIVTYVCLLEQGFCG